MILWLRARNGEQHCIDEITPELPACGVGIESEDDIVRREAFSRIVELDAAAHEIERQREAIMADARARAQALLEEAQAEAARLREDAEREYKTAAERGHEAGREQGLADWYERCARSAAGQRRVQSLLRERIVDLVVDATEQIVRNVDVSALFARSAEVVERLVEGSTYLRVRVHPADEAAAASEFDRLAALWRERGHGVAVTVIADRAVARGACLCESDLGTVDASLDTQLAALRSAVTRAVQRTAAPSADGADEAAAADGEVEFHAPSSSDAQDGHDSRGQYDAGAGHELDFDDEADTHTDFGIGAGHGSGVIHRYDAHEQTDGEEQLDAETYVDAQATADHGEQHDPFAMPWLGDPDYDRIAHPDHHAAGQS